jgi:HKD family nuclease
MSLRIRTLGPGPRSLGLTPVGGYLKNALRRATPQSQFRVIVALVEVQGLAMLRDEIGSIVRNRGSVEAIVGIDLGISKDALISLEALVGNRGIRIYRNPADATFHPKLYLLKSSTEALVVVGSSNLTGQGLRSNFEVNMAFKLDLSETSDARFYRHFEVMFSNLWRSRSSLPLSPSLKKYLTRVKMRQRPTGPPRRGGPFVGEGHGWSFTGWEGKPTFLMTLSHNDVSGARAFDDYIRIPVKAVKNNPAFWRWGRRSFSSSTTAETRLLVKYGRVRLSRRFYFVGSVDEFRLLLPEVYNLGSAYVGSIFRITRETGGYKAEVVSPTNRRHPSLLALCYETSPRGSALIPKRWGYV